MLCEFAIEPAVLSTWDNFRYFIDRVGVEHGRLIAQFPKSWKRLVYEALTEFRGTTRMAVVEERLRRLDPAITKSRRPYDGSREWLVNAEAQQTGNSPFDAIIACSNPRKNTAVLVATDVSDETPRWAVPRERKIARRALDLATAASSLISCSREILLVDPHFNPWEPRWREAFAAVCKALETTRQPPTRTELHVSAWRPDGQPKWDVHEFCRECTRRLAVSVPAGLRIRIVIWKQKAGGERIHGRYVLTERGGIRFEGGLDPGSDGETTDVSLLTRQLYDERWKDYNETSTTFELQREHYVAGTGITA